MASKLPTLPDNSNDLLYIKRVVKGTQKCCGYKKEYLVKSLTTMEQGFIVCKVCTGIMRQPTLYKGVATCLMCSENPNELIEVNVVQDSVAALEIKCPLLRNCKWKGKLSEAETHLNTCITFLIECSDCKQIFPRGDTDKHKAILCPLRLVDCEYCSSRSGPSKDLERHYQVCPDYPIDCPNGCGSKLHRNTMATHRSECELEEVTCPFSEYGCMANPVLRKDLLAHKKEFVVEHQYISFVGMSERINKLEKESTEIIWKLKTMKQLDGVEWEIQIPSTGNFKQIPFYVNNYKLRIYIFAGYSSNDLKLLYFSINRIEGEFDKRLGKAALTHYRVITVDKQDYSKSHYEDGPMNYQLKIGASSGTFCSIFPSTWRRYATTDNCISFRLYFDINTHPPIGTVPKENATRPT